MPVLVMQLGAEAVFVGSGIFMKDSTTFADPEEAAKRAKAIVQAATHYQDPKVLLEVSENLQGAMKGLAVVGIGRSPNAANPRLVSKRQTGRATQPAFHVHRHNRLRRHCSAAHPDLLSAILSQRSLAPLGTTA